MLWSTDSDAMLKDDFRMKQDLIDGIKTYNKKLVERMKNIQITSARKSSKYIGFLGLAFAITIGIYMWFSYVVVQAVEQEAINRTEQTVSQAGKTQVKTDVSNKLKLNMILLGVQLFLLLSLPGIVRELQKSRLGKIINKSAQIQFLKLSPRLE